jgi:hypothetical protein
MAMFFEKGYTNIKIIPITPSLCTNAISRSSQDIKDVDNQKKSYQQKLRQDQYLWPSGFL